MLHNESQRRASQTRLQQQQQRDIQSREDTTESEQSALNDRIELTTISSPAAIKEVRQLTQKQSEVIVTSVQAEAAALIHPPTFQASSNIKLSQPPRSQSSLQKNGSGNGQGEIDNMGNIHSHTMKTIVVTSNSNSSSQAAVGFSPMHANSGTDNIIGATTKGIGRVYFENLTGNNGPNHHEMTPQKPILHQQIEHHSGGGRIPIKTNNLTEKSQSPIKPFLAASNSTFRKAGIAGSGTSGSPDNRIVVTGDDILIEYVRRIVNLIKQAHNQDIELEITTQRKLEQFISHKIWQPKDQGAKQANGSSSSQLSAQQPLWQRLETRFTEMGDRKRRLFMKKSQAAQQIDPKKSQDQLEKLFKAQEKQKNEIVKDFSSNELELMLVQSNKNNPIEVVTLLLSLNQSHSQANSGQAQIYSSISLGYGGILTKLEMDVSKNKGLHFKSGQEHEEKAFDYHTMLNQHSLPKDRQYQSSISTSAKLRSSDDSFTHVIALSNSVQSHQAAPFSTNSTKKDLSAQFQSSSIKEQLKHQTSGIGGASSTNVPLPPPGGYHSNTITNHNNNNNTMICSNTTLMSNFANATIGTAGVVSLKTSTNKGNAKAQGSFDRSDIAMQTGLTLTHPGNNKLLGQVILTNQQSETGKKIVLPQIVAGQSSTNPSSQYHSNSNQQYSTNSMHQSKNNSTQQHKSVGASQNNQGAYDVYSTTSSQGYSLMNQQQASSTGLDSGNGGRGSKYRANKIAAGMSPSLLSSGPVDHQNKFSLTKNLMRGGGLGNDALNTSSSIPVAVTTSSGINSVVGAPTGGSNSKFNDSLNRGGVGGGNSSSINLNAQLIHHKTGAH